MVTISKRLFFLFVLFTPCYLLSQTPLTIPGLELWLKSDSGVVLNGNAVSQWSDLSGKNFHCVQSNAVQQPLWVDSVSTINNSPVLRFDGTDDFIKQDSTITIGTAFIVCNWNGGGITFPNYNGLFSRATGSPNPVYIFIMKAGTDNFYTGTPYTSFETNTYINSFSSSQLFPLDKYKIICGEDNIPDGYNSSIIGNNPLDGGNCYWNGDIAEIIVYDTLLTSTQREQVEQYLRYKYAPPVNLGADITVNYGFCATKLNAHKDWFTSYAWNTGGTIDSITPNKSGEYSVSVTDIFGYPSSDTIKITYLGNLNPFPDTTICYGDTLVWNTQLNKTGYSFLWQDNSTDSLFKITQAGQYYVTVTDTIGVSGCSAKSYTLNVTVNNFPQTTSLGADKSMCSGESLYLSSGAGQAVSYLWSTGATTSSIAITTTGTYSVTVQNSMGCTARDTIDIIVSGTAPVVNFIADTVCQGDSTTFKDLSTSVNGITLWSWSFGDATTSSVQNPKHLYASSGTFVVTLTATTSVGCTNTAIKTILVNTMPITAFSFVQPLCKGDSVWFKDMTTINNGVINTWQWNFGDTASGSNSSVQQNPFHVFSKSGDFLIYLKVTSNAGCTDSTQNVVNVRRNNNCSFPSSVAGLKVWLVGDSIDLSGNSITTWKDISGNNNDAVQNIGINKPLWKDSISGLNNNPVIRFDGLNDHMKINNPIKIGSAFILSSWRGGGSVFSTYSGLMTQSSSIPAPSYIYVLTAATKDYYSNAVNTVFGSNIYKNSTASSEYTMDNIYQITGGISSGTSSTFSDIIIGNNPLDGGNCYWNGDIAEIIVYDTLLTSVQREQVEQYLRYKYAPPVNLGADITVNYGFCATKLNAHKDWFTSYAWSTSQTTDSILPDKSGEYSVDVTDIFGYSSSDTIKITYPGNLHPFPDTTICYGDTLVWNTQLNKTGYSFLWQDNSTDSLFKITQAGQYYVTVTDTIGVSGCSAKSYTLNVTVNNFPQTTSLGADKSMCSGESLYLSSGAGQAVSYLWSTGATTSSIAITTTGTYSVTVQNSMGCTARDTIDINIKGVAPIAGFLSPSVCFGSAFSFTDTSSVIAPDKIALWNWNFGDGSPTNTLQNPTHSYTTAGTFTVALSIVSDSGCTAQITKPVTVNPKPNAGFSSSPSCSGTPIQFYDQSLVINSTINQWEWNFGDPSSGLNNTSLLKNPIHVYSVPATYTTTLIVTTTSGCKDTIVNIITVDQSPSASFNALGVCKGIQTVFQNTSVGNIANWQWNFGDFTPISTMQNPSHAYSSAGTYSVTLFVIDLNGCTNITTDTVHVYSIPVPKFTPDSICFNSPSQLNDNSTVNNSVISLWNWDFSSFGSSSLQNPTVTYTVTGTHSVILTVTSAQSCTASATQTISVLPEPIADFTFSPTFGAPPLTVLFNSNSSSSNTNIFWWDFGDGGQSSLSNPSYTYNDTGLYSILFIAESKFGCKDSLRDTLRVAIPLLDIAVKTINISTSNTIKMSALLYNAGTLDITNMELVAYFNNGTRVHESWTGNLKPYTFITYQFNSSFENDNNKHSIICVDVLKVNHKDDDNSTNNHSCVSVTNEFTLLDPFPNPTDNEIYFLFTLPITKMVKAEVLDAEGRLIENLLDKEMSQGLNTITYNTMPLQKGMYVLKFEYDGRVEIKKFLKK